MITRIILTILLLFIMTIPAVFAQSEDDEQSDTQDLEQIQRIKDIVASKVAELDLVEKKGILGSVSEISNTQILIKDNKDNTRTIDIDELTTFEGEDEIGISDLSEGDKMSFVGLYNKDTKRLLARSISEANAIPESFSGAVADIDSENFQITVVRDDGSTLLVDIEKSTKTNSYEKGGDIEKSGFSNIEKGQRLIVTGFYDTKDEGVLNASRILQFTDIELSQKMIESLANYAPPTPTQTQADENAKNEE